MLTHVTVVCRPQHLLHPQPQPLQNSALKPQQLQRLQNQRLLVVQRTMLSVYVQELVIHGQWLELSHVIAACQLQHRLQPLLHRQLFQPLDLNPLLYQPLRHSPVPQQTPNASVPNHVTHNLLQRQAPVIVECQLLLLPQPLHQHLSRPQPIRLHSLAKLVTLIVSVLVHVTPVL